MTKEKQIIEEMAEVIKSSLDGLGCGNFNFTGEEISIMFAKALYNAGYRKQEWISVEERLPEESCEVLTVDRTGVMYLAPYSDRYKAFNATDEDGGDRWKLTVTHWMPLPEAPRMKGGAI